MAFNKRTWKGRQGTGLNKFSINGATPVTVINQPDSVTEQGDALSAGNLNDLEDRIYTAFEDEATAREDADTDLKDAIEGNSQRIENLEVAVSGSLVQTNTDATMANAKVITNANEILPWAILKRVGARAVAWNQIIQTREGIPHANQYYPMFIEQALNIVNGHKYLFSALAPAGCNVYRQDQTGLSVGSYYYTVTNDTRIDFIATATETRTMTASQVSAVISKTSTTEQGYQLDNCMVFDLTAMGEYDSTLTDAQNIAKFRAKYPASYYPYNTGSIIPLNPSAFKVVGKNKYTRTYVTDALNVEYESWASGRKVGALNMPVIAGQTYVVSQNGTAMAVRYGFLDVSGLVIGGSYANASVLTAPSNAVALRWRSLADETSDLGGVTMVQIGSTATAYEPYSETTIDTSFTEDYLYVNEDCHDYSENVLVNGVMRRKEHKGIVGSYTFSGDENWSRNSDSWGINFYLTFSQMKSFPSGSDVNISFPLYRTVSWTAFASGADMAISAINQQIRVNDSSMTDKTASEFAQHMAGKTIYFELASPSTPTLHDPIPNFPCEDGTTITAVTPQTDLVNSIDVPSTIAYMTKIGG